MQVASSTDRPEVETSSVPTMTSTRSAAQPASLLRWLIRPEKAVSLVVAAADTGSMGYEVEPALARGVASTSCPVMQGAIDSSQSWVGFHDPAVGSVADSAKQQRCAGQPKTSLAAMLGPAYFAAPEEP